MGHTGSIIRITQGTSIVDAVDTLEPRGHKGADGDLLGRKNRDVTPNVDIPTGEGWHVHNGYVEAKVRIGSCERPACRGDKKPGTSSSVSKRDRSNAYRDGETTESQHYQQESINMQMPFGITTDRATYHYASTGEIPSSLN